MLGYVKIIFQPVKHFFLLIFILSLSYITKAQTPCTIVLKDRSVIEAYHLGPTEICKKGRKKANSFDHPIYIVNSDNNESVVLNNLSLISEVRIEDYKPISSDLGTYCITIIIKFKDGTEEKITDASLKCKENDQSFAISILPIQIKQSENNLQQIDLDIRNIETLIF